MKSLKRYFNNRECSEYRKYLNELLTLGGSNGLINNAIEHPPEIINGKPYHKTISLDFTGVSASTLLDGSGSFIDSNKKSNSLFEKILQSLPSLNEKGIKLRFRVLFVYPYSDYAFSRVQAEFTDKRATIEKPDYIRNFELIKKIDEKTFYRSTFYSNQVDCLNELQCLIKDYNLESSENPNKVRVRFSTIGSSLCILFINNTVIYDPYILAKKSRKERRLVVGLPITIIKKPKAIEKNTNINFEFESIRDHWRYLWTHDTTLYCSDVTDYNPKTVEGLENIRPPNLVDFEAKSQRIISLLDDPPPDETEIKKWKFKVQKDFEYSTRNISSPFEKEAVFITCSWKKEKRKEPWPNLFATYIENWLNIDLGHKSENKCIDVVLVRSEISKKMHDEIYDGLNKSSLAIIIISKDIYDKENDKWYAKPNIYHELGYLQKELDIKGRIIIMVEDGVEYPSNIKHLTLLFFSKSDFNEKYIRVIKWLNIGHIPKKHLTKAVSEHSKRIDTNTNIYIT